jgi:UDP-N-acetylmuramoylalanine--D-glutamate ligase
MNKIKIIPPVAILGFGVEGKAALDFCQSQRIEDITICDENNEMPAGEQAPVRLQNFFQNLSAFKTIIRSPGIHYRRMEILEAKEAGATITSMTEMILELAKDRITAVTGSNGKTTTTTLLGEMLKAHYNHQIIIGGNDRKPVLQEAMGHSNWPILLEVSSFQFADLKVSPHISAVLNITPNHMDWHENMEDYIHAKQNLIAHQSPNDWAVLNADNENSAKLAENAPGQVFWVNRKAGKAWVVWEDETLLIHFGNEEKTVIQKKDILLKTHSDNILFAAALAAIHEVDPKIIVDTLTNFPGAEHRLEFIRELNGMRFYNDSACTTPESAEVAISQFPEAKLILLLGGSSKNADFRFLAYQVVKNKVRVVLYGEEGRRIKAAIEEEGGDNLIIATNESDDFASVVTNALHAAGSGDNIVLSPACASFDMFKNSKDRGTQFKTIVNQL